MSGLRVSVARDGVSLGRALPGGCPDAKSSDFPLRTMAAIASVPFARECSAVERPMRPRLSLVDPRLRQNRLLRMLPDEAWERISPQLQLQEFLPGTVLEEPGMTPTHVYFPTDAIVSLLHVTNDGAASEVARVGFEGLVGISIFLGGHGPSSRAVVQGGGHAFRVRSNVMKDAFERSGPVQRLLLRYTQSLLTQMAQTAVCNRRHSVRQQLCRFLLLSLDRMPGNELSTTHERIAGMLGVRREGVTDAAGDLQRMGAVRCSRGRITVLDREVLEAHVCECYAAVQRESARLLPDVMAT
jgi:CRP-like cAMP-binding protein